MRLSSESRSAIQWHDRFLRIHGERRSRRGTMVAAITDLPGFCPAV